jgi:hypothetical protein
MMRRNVAQLIARTTLARIDAAMTAIIDFKDIPSRGLDLHAVERVRPGNPLAINSALINARPSATQWCPWLGADDAPQRRKDRRATSADQAWPPIFANRPRSFGVMPAQRIAIKPKRPPSNATCRHVPCVVSPRKIHHRNHMVRSKREPTAAFATGPSS